MGTVFLVAALRQQSKEMHPLTALCKRNLATGYFIPRAAHLTAYAFFFKLLCSFQVVPHKLAKSNQGHIFAFSHHLLRIEVSETV